MTSASAASSRVLELSFVDLHGQEHKLSDYRGKWVVINVWASWCPPCMAEIPELIEFHDSFSADKAVVLGANMEPRLDEELLNEVVDGMFISYPVFRVRDSHIKVLGKVSGLPTTFIISPDGKLSQRYVGQISRHYLESKLNLD